MKKIEMSKSVIGVLLLGSAVLFVGCTKSDYDKLVAKELARNIRYDSLFLGYKFGMPREDFLTYTATLNKKGMLIMGPGTLSIQYELDTPQLKGKTYVWFYPKFKDDRITRMPVEFTYKSWAPWNKDLSVDTLLLDVKRLYEKWYGGRFIEVKNEDGTQVLWVKVDGNRRIRLYKKNISTVHSDFTNLLELEKSEDKVKE